MKIIIANKFYYNRGGDCVASISLERLLKQHGHNVAFFSMQHPLNIQSEWDSFFPSNIDFQSKKISNKINSLIRLYYSNEVKKKFINLIETFKPDIVHLNNIHSQLSPLIGEIAHKKGIKVIWTLHDYKLICPSYSCLNKSQICELCIQNNNPIHVVKERCMKNSFLASLLAYFEAIIWNKNRIINNTDIFISPSSFLANKMIEAGYPAKKIKIMHNFINRSFSNNIKTIKSNYCCYLGRLSDEKGIKTLIKATESTKFQLKIIGTGPLEKQLNKNNSNIEFCGFKEWEEISSILQDSKFLILPSEWYENNPISVIESLCLGTPVLGSKIGGIPEIIDINQNGLLFEPGNVNDLKEKIELMFNSDFDYNTISKNAREIFSAENYYNKLIKIYNE